MILINLISPHLAHDSMRHICRRIMLSNTVTFVVKLTKVFFHKFEKLQICQSIRSLIFFYDLAHRKISVR